MRFSEIDALKGLSILGVIFAHSTFNDRFDITTLDYIKTLQSLFGWCVLGFFFASGFLIKTRPSSTYELIRMVKKQFFKLIIPCLIFSLTYKLIMLGLSATPLLHQQPIIFSNFYIIIDFLFVPIGPQFYFLYYLFAISSVIAVIQLWLSNNSLLILFSTLFAVSPALNFAPDLTYGPSGHIIPLYIFSYLLGYGLSNQYKTIKKSYYLMLLLPICTASIYSDNYLYLYALIPFMLLMALRNLPIATRIINKTQLGIYSSAIFVWHAPITLAFVSIVMVKLIGNQPTVLLPIFILTIALSILLSKVTAKSHFLRHWRF